MQLCNYEAMTFTTTTNQDSRFGINLNSPLTNGDYLVNLSASLNNDYVELPEFTLTIGSGYTTVAGSSIFIDSGSEAGMTKEKPADASKVSGPEILKQVQDDEFPTPQPTPTDSALIFTPGVNSADTPGVLPLNLFQKILNFFKKILP